MSRFTPRGRIVAMLFSAVSASALALPALAQENTDASAETGAAAEVATAPTDINQVVATVNGTDITLGQVIMMRAQLPDQYQAMPDKQLFDAMVDQAVVQVLLAEQARAAGAEDTPEAKLRALIDTRTYLAETEMRRVMNEAATDEAVKAAYDQMVADFVPAQEVKASHILVDSEEKAEEIKQQIADGASFADMAAEHGTDGTKTRGGDLGWFTKDMMVPDFANAAFDAPEGEVVGPIKTQFGYHLILVTGKRDTQPPAFDEVEPQLKQQVSTEAARALILNARENADVIMNENQPAPAQIRDDAAISAN